jgi:SAM-dependent methyltransferase
MKDPHLSQVLRMKEMIENLDLAPAHQSIGELNNNYAIEVYQDLDASKLAKKFTGMLAQLEKDADNIIEYREELLSKLDARISQYGSKYFAESYAIYERHMQMYHDRSPYLTDVDRDRQELHRKMYNVTRDIILGRIGLYADWHHPGLEIGPGDAVWTGNLVAFQPLYIADINQDFLNSTRETFNEQYQSRLMDYLIKGNDLGELPQNQFGFIFSWNVFDYFPIDVIKTYLQQIYHLLKPGGVFMFSYNNCDRSRNVEFVEQGHMCYTPGSLLKELIASMDFELEAAYDLDASISWLEIRRPGTLTSTRVRPPFGTIENIIDLQKP